MLRLSVVAVGESERILGYFIEEAQEHLVTLEKGILELSTVVNESERINELFRAAHSLKGGAAMLNLNSIQKTSHRLEDAFKVLRDGEAYVDQKLVSLFFDAFDVLQGLIVRLQSGLGLQEDEGEAIVKEAEPIFLELQQHLKISKGSKTETASPPREEQSNQDSFNEIIKGLRKMLQRFKQKPTATNREELEQICENLKKAAPRIKEWQELVEKAKSAIANPKHSYSLLAPVVIKELKQGADYIDLGEEENIVPSQALIKLAEAKMPQILLTVEPQTAASVILQTFSKNQVSQLVKILQANSK